MSLGPRQYEASVQSELGSKVNAFAAMLSTRIGSQNLYSCGSTPTAPVLTTC